MATPQPSYRPSPVPTTLAPTPEPSGKPSADPTAEPTALPGDPTPRPATKEPTDEPTYRRATARGNEGAARRPSDGGTNGSSRAIRGVSPRLGRRRRALSAAAPNGQQSMLGLAGVPRASGSAARRWLEVSTRPGGRFRGRDADRPRARRCRGRDQTASGDRSVGRLASSPLRAGRPRARRRRDRRKRRPTNQRRRAPGRPTNRRPSRRARDRRRSRRPSSPATSR